MVVGALAVEWKALAGTLDGRDSILLGKLQQIDCAACALECRLVLV